MPAISSPSDNCRWAARWRIGTTVAAICLAQGGVCGLAALPVVLSWVFIAASITSPAARAGALSLMLVPSVRGLRPVPDGSLGRRHAGVMGGALHGQRRDAPHRPPGLRELAVRDLDHNLIEHGDDVVIGSDVHLSGHTVEGGIVKTAAVRVGRGVTIGLGSVVDIGVNVGPGCVAITWIRRVLPSPRGP